MFQGYGIRRGVKMKFADLPIGTKFVDDIVLGAHSYDYLTKISESSYVYESTLTEWGWNWDSDVYPVLEWEDQCTTL